MKRLLTLCCVCATLLLAMSLGGCGSDSTPSTLTVHAGGLVYEEAGGITPAYWNNLTLTELERPNSQGGVSAMTGDGTNLYAAGSVLGDSGTMVPALWKNGKITILPTDSTDVDSIALGVRTSGGSVYVAGGSATTLGVPWPAYWKDGVLNHLETKLEGGLAEDLTFYNNDLYVTGFTVENGKGLPVYWKNGQMVELSYSVPDGWDFVDGLTYSISTVNADTYIFGSLIFLSDEGVRIEKPVYWKNGVMVSLFPLESKTEEGFASKGTVSAGHTYMAGYVRDDDNLYRPVVWVDGQMQRLSMVDQTLFGEVLNVYVQNGTVYLSGYTTRLLDPNVNPKTVANVPCYWVNGIRVDLPVVSGTASLPATSVTYNLWKNNATLNNLAASRDSGVAYTVFAQ